MARYEHIAVYIMASRPFGVLYVGVTSDLIRRVHEHREGLVDGFTSRYGCKLLVWWEQHATMADAIRREKALKRYNRAWKMKLIEDMNPEWRDLWPTICS